MPSCAPGFCVSSLGPSKEVAANRTDATPANCYTLHAPKSRDIVLFLPLSSSSCHIVTVRVTLVGRHPYACGCQTSSSMAQIWPVRNAVLLGSSRATQPRKAQSLMLLSSAVATRAVSDAGSAMAVSDLQP
jgi:hypothetical protein